MAGRPDAPLRLLLGADANAVNYASVAAETISETDRVWREVSLSVTP